MPSATLQALPEAVAVVVCTGDPVAVAPEYTLTVIVGRSPARTPATPPTVGVAVLT